MGQRHTDSRFACRVSGRRSSLPSNALFRPMFTCPAMEALTGDEAWLGAMLETEAALARSCAAAGLIPLAAAEVVTRVCRTGVFDPESLGAAAVAAGNPVIPLMEALSALVEADLEGYVHFGAT